MESNFRTRLLLKHIKRDERYGFYIVLTLFIFVLLFLGNIIFVDGLLITNQYAKRQQVPVTRVQPAVTTLPTQPVVAAEPPIVVSPTKTPSQVILAPQVKDYYIPFGTGNSAVIDWTDIVGAAAIIDTAQYGRLKQAIFEASVSVPTANEAVWVRLFDKTDKHPVWYSEVGVSNGQDNALLFSQPVVLDIGNKLYQVQMKTEFTYPATLVQARLHITIQ